VPTRIRRSRQDKDRGFTLIELLVVIIIIGILAAIAIPVFINQRKKGYDAQAKSDLRNMATAEESYVVDAPVAYVTCASAAACAATGALGGYGFKTSPTVHVAVVADTNKGYCAVSQSQSGNYYIYDSEAGGFQPYASTTPPTAVNDGISVGACATPNLVSGTTPYPSPA